MVAIQKGENTLRTEDILACIEKHGDSVALILFSGEFYFKMYILPTFSREMV